MVAASDDDMVEQSYIEETRSRGNTLRKFHILSAWLRISRGMIMD
jgi:hypothetical protein